MKVIKRAPCRQLKTHQRNCNIIYKKIINLLRATFTDIEAYDKKDFSDSGSKQLSDSYLKFRSL